LVWPSKKHTPAYNETIFELVNTIVAYAIISYEALTQNKTLVTQGDHHYNK